MSYFDQLRLLLYCLYYSNPYADLLKVVKPYTAFQPVGSTSPHEVLIFPSKFAAVHYKHPTSWSGYLPVSGTPTQKKD